MANAICRICGDIVLTNIQIPEDALTIEARTIIGQHLSKHKFTDYFSFEPEQRLL